MRTSIWASMVAVALLSAGGCKKKSESGKEMDRAATSASKAWNVDAFVSSVAQFLS